MTISKTVIKAVKSSQSILKQNALEVTTKMYEILFNKNPELKTLFSSADQPMKLAQAIIAYSTHIEDLNILRPVLYSISEKHVAANIKSKHYLLVAEALLEAMEIILTKEVFNNELKKAWAEAYYNLAAILIQTEQKLYIKLDNKEAVNTN